MSDDLAPIEEAGDHEHRPIEVEDDTRSILLQLRELTEHARQMPLSASVMINRDEYLVLVQAALDALPEELREARWLLREREEFLARAAKEAEALIEAARVRAGRMVERTEVVREARHTAERIIDAADTEARKLRNEAEDYVDQKLAAFEVVLERTISTVAAGRDRLQVHTGSPQLDAATEEEDEASSEFFDQDLA